MNFTELENSILKELDGYINLWSIDGTTDALDNRIIAMRMAKKIVQEKIQIARNWGVESAVDETIPMCLNCDNRGGKLELSNTRFDSHCYECRLTGKLMMQDAYCDSWSAKAGITQLITAPEYMYDE